MKNKINISKREKEELLKVSKNPKKDYKKMLKGYPIQYLIGYSNFYGYKFLINKNTLIPRFETEFLVEKTINYIKKYLPKVKKIIDLGTGSGCIAITLYKKIPISIEGVDISLKALKVAKKNNVINSTNVNFYKYNILKELKGKYDVIISNPPYISKTEIIEYSVKKYEPKKALYAKEEGLKYYKKILTNSVNHLNKKSLIAFEIGRNQADKVKEIAKRVFPKSTIIVEKDLNNKNRYLFIFNGICIKNN